MAVYKATYCYPFLTAYDPRIPVTSPASVKWLTCKVDSSNKSITGYKIRILNEYNDVIFPVNNEEYISPISELTPTTVNNIMYLNNVELVNQAWKTNSGLNGTYLNIPFFQNKNSKVNISANAIYYNVNKFIDYVLTPTAANEVDNSDSWTNTSTTELAYTAGTYTGIVNGDKIQVGNTVLVIKNDSTQVYTYNENNNLSLIASYLTDGDLIVITRGDYHNSIYKYNNASNCALAPSDTVLWEDALGNPIQFGRFGNIYKWDITLYQGAGQEIYSNDLFFVMDYSNLNVAKYYDMILQEGTVLGSRPSRIQITYKTNDIANEILPLNKDGSSTILYGSYMQLFTSAMEESTNRIYVNSYDSTYGHIYPLDSDANTLSIQGSKYAQFFKHSNNIEYITAGDIVDVAPTITNGNAVWTNNLVSKPVGNVELAGIQDFDGYPGETGQLVLLMYQTAPQENGVYKMESDLNNTITVDSIVYKRDESLDHYQELEGINTIVAFAWSNSDDSTKQTVYTRYRCPKINAGESGEQDFAYSNVDCITDPKTITAASLTYWTRSGSYDEWGDFIGKILFVQYGDLNGRHNFESLANAGGSLLVNPYNNRYNNYEGYSPLYFSPEKPILLFSQKLEDYNVIACGEVVVSNNTVSVDKITLTASQYGIKVEDGIGTLIQVNSTSDNYTVVDLNLSSRSPQYFYISDGENNAHSVVKIEANGQITLNCEELSTAEILTNTIYRTYISPYTNLNSLMALQFKDNYINYADQTSSYYLLIDKVNTTLWYITHKELKEPLASYNYLNQNSNIPYQYKLTSFYRLSDENPFYFYENPYIDIGAEQDNEIEIGTQMFVDNTNASVMPINSEAGYNIDNPQANPEFNKNFTWNQCLQLLQYTPSSGIVPAHNFQLYNPSTHSYIDVSIPAYYEGDFLREGGTTDSSTTTDFQTVSSEEFLNTYGFLYLSNYESVYYPDNASATRLPLEVNIIASDLQEGYKLNLIGYYNQQQGASWESYRWIISKPVFYPGTFEDYKDDLDNALKYIVDETVLQDTGKKFDKEINVNFYGLFSPTTDNIVHTEPYLVTLYVEDSLGNILTKQQLVTVDSANVLSYDKYLSTFTAKLNCVQMCVDLTINPYWCSTQTGEVTTEYLQSFSVFRREYRQYQNENNPSETIEVIGDQWYPVMVNVNSDDYISQENQTITIHDFNIKNGYSYQYVIFPNISTDAATSIVQTPYIFANTESGNAQFIYTNSQPVEVNMVYWSLVELTQADNLIDAPIIDTTYKAVPDNVWLFKFGLDTGSITQNLSKNSLTTLGTFDKIGHGLTNYESGSISAYLGSEIVPAAKSSYLERLPKAQLTPLTTNEKMAMLNAWKAFVFSKSPKLLRDTKGNSWIVQITESSTTTNNNISIYPSMISFSWKQIGDTSTCVIYNDKDSDFVGLPTSNCVGKIWHKI